MSRNLLHISKLEDFKRFLDDKNIPWRNGRGGPLSYEVIQVRFDKSNWAAVYKRNEMPEHYTVDRRLDGLVKAFTKEKRK